jgi:gliding motility-associated-like protein
MAMRKLFFLLNLISGLVVLKLNSQTTTTYSILSTAYNRSTGSFFSLGNVDNYWFLTRMEDMVIPNNPGSVVLYPNSPVYVVSNAGNNSYAGIIPNHSINTNGTTTSLGQKLITFRTYFTLPNLLVTSNRYSLAFKMSADDAVYDVKLNGTKKGQFLTNTYNNIPGVPKPYLLNVPVCDTDFVSGQNFIDVTIADAGGAVGFYAEVILYEVTGSPGTQLLAGALCTSGVGSAVATLTSNIANPLISYSWTNSAGTIVSQSNSTSSLTNSVTNLPNGLYTVLSEIAGHCGATSVQTVNINCTPTSTVPPICSGTLGAPVFLEDFGSGVSLYGPALAPGITNYPYMQGVPNNGTYVIASSSNPSGTNAGYVDDNRDHTGNSNGYMMVVNSDYAASEIYRRHVTGLCQGTTYVFSAYLANNNSPDAVNNVCVGNYVYANIKFQVEYPLGTVQGSVTSGNLQVAPTSTALPWIQYGFVFTTGPGQTSVDVVLKNNAPGGCGNDYVVDDISLSPCGPGVNLSIAQNKTVFCEGEAVTLQSTFTSGGYTNPQYQWQYSSNGGATWNDISGATSINYSIAAVTFSQAGMYHLVVAENGNINLPSCRIMTAPLTFSVSSGTLTVSSATICSGASATLTVTGATSYTWSTGSNASFISVNPAVTTSYTVMGITGTCTSQAVSTVSVLPSATISVTPAQTLICAGESVTLTAGGFSTYTWSPGATLSSSTGSVVVASPAATTIYTVTGAAGSCINTATASITAVALPTLVLSPNATICSGTTASVSLTAGGAVTYTWSNSSSLSSATGSAVVASPNSTTSYTVTGSIASCTNSAVVTVSVNQSPTITAVSIDPTSCGLANGSVTLTSLPPGNGYTWSSGVSSVTNTAYALAAGNYTVNAYNGSCQTSTVITVAGSIPLSITSVTVTPSGCSVNNGSIKVTDNLAGSSYSWSPNVSTTGTASNLSPGTYSLTITNGACSTPTVLTVGLINGPDGFSTIANNAFCANADGSFTVTSITGGLAPYQCSFNGAGFSATISYSNLSHGTYTLTVRDANNCLYTNTLSIGKTTVSSVSDITVNAPNCFENDGSVIINSISGGTAPYLVNPNHTAYTPNRVYEQLGQGTYTFSVLDSNGCVTDNIIIMPENNGEYTLYVPNAFTPNNDRVNDVWYAQGTCIQGFKCQVFNRWGEKIVEFSDFKEGWDGTYKGQKVPDDVYVYLIKATVNQKTVTKRGHVTVLK